VKQAAHLSPALKISPVEVGTCYRLSMKSQRPREKTKTHFEQVPISLVAKVATQSSELEQPPVVCSICSQNVMLEQCKIDEHGKPVHENCYVTKLAKSTRLRVLRKHTRP
jgi:hypothetical protein